MDEAWRAEVEFHYLMKPENSDRYLIIPGELTEYPEDKCRQEAEFKYRRALKKGTKDNLCSYTLKPGPVIC